ncbi:MAG: prepilin peptidase [Chloroflexi bacterium]|nr:prepilin peptidase [Chloroflexota bacterium]
MNITFIIPIFIGWLAGWIVNYLADVLPFTRRLSHPSCPHCDAQFTWMDYFLFRPCPNGHPRKVRLWLVQIILLALSVYIWIRPPTKLGFLIGILLLIYFGLIFVIDMEHRLILHPTSVFGSLLGLIVGWLKWGPLPTLLGGLCGLLIMLALYFFGVLFTRIRAKRMLARGEEADDEEALGAGDVILLTILGLMLGWPLIWFGMLFGVLLGGLVSFILVLWLVITRKYSKNALMIFIPYGPYFITTAALIIFFPKFISMIVPK